MVEAIGFQTDGYFVVQLSDGRTIAIPEGDLIGLSSVCRNADLFTRPPLREEDNPYFLSACYERAQADNHSWDAALDAHVLEITGDED